jgi:hypothetical protein
MPHTVASDTLLDPADGKVRPVVRAGERVLNQRGRPVVSQGIWLTPFLKINEVRKHWMLGYWHVGNLPSGRVNAHAHRQNRARTAA